MTENSARIQINQVSKQFKALISEKHLIVLARRIHQNLRTQADCTRSYKPFHNQIRPTMPFDEKHYFVIPFQLSEHQFALHIMRY